jgi:hypothetical protein
MTAANERHNRTIYRYGALGCGHHGHVILLPDHKIGYYRLQNVTSFDLSSGWLNFLDAGGRATSTLRCYEDANCFLSNDHRGLYLLPELELEDRPAAPPGLPAVVVNTIPKSGTYFMEAALATLGFRPTRLHLAAKSCHGNRGIADADIHIAPQNRQINVPAGAIALIMQRGDLAVGHIDDPAELASIRDAGVTIIQCVRDLRDVVLSLFRFKRSVVAPVSAADLLWRSLPEREGFLAFLCYAADRDIDYIARVAKAILACPDTVIRYEDVASGPVSDDAVSRLAQTLSIGQDAARMALTTGQSIPTSTSSGQRARYDDVWSGPVQSFFESTGLAELNEALGYGRGS